MRSLNFLINFLIIFAFCLAIALFAIENTGSASISLIPGYQVEAPLSVELILAMGIGAVLAWLFGIWTGLQNQISNFQQSQRIRAKDKQIKELEENMEKLKEEAEKQQQLLPSSEETTSAA